MLLDIGSPLFGFDRDGPYSRRSPAFLSNRSLRPRLFPAILLASAPPTPLLGAAMDGVSRLLVRDAGFRHTSPTGRRAGQPSGHPRHRAGVDRRHPGFRAPGQEIPHWLQPPPDPQPSDRMPKSRQWPPARFAAFAVICSEISAIVGFVPVNPAAHYLVRPRQRHIMRSWQFCRRQLCRQGALAPIRPLSEKICTVSAHPRST